MIVPPLLSYFDKVTSELSIGAPTSFDKKFGDVAAFSRFREYLKCLQKGGRPPQTILASTRVRLCHSLTFLLLPTIHFLEEKASDETEAFISSFSILPLPFLSFSLPNFCAGECLSFWRRFEESKYKEDKDESERIDEASSISKERGRGDGSRW